MDKEEKSKVEEAATAASEGSVPRPRAVLRVIFIILAVALSIWILYLIKSVIFLVIISYFFAHFIMPLVDLVQRLLHLRKSPGGRTLATGVVYLWILGLLTLGAFLLLPTIGEQMNDLIKQAPAYLTRLQQHGPVLEELYAKYRVPMAVRNSLERMATQSLADAGKYAREAALKLASALRYLPFLILVPILAFFFLKDGDLIRRSLLKMLPRGSMRWRGGDFLQDANQTLASYIRSQLIAGAFIAFVCCVGFEVIRVPYALVMGLFAGVLEFIPLAGPAAVMIVVTIVTGFKSISHAALVLLFLVVLRIVEDYIVFPRIIGRGIRMHPLAVILAILCGAEIGGIIGIFLAVPIIAIFTVAYQHWQEQTGKESIVGSILDTESTSQNVIPSESREPLGSDKPPRPSS